MKKKITQRLVVLALGCFYLTLNVEAQGVYQLPNPDFELWEKGVKLDGSVTTYDEPVGWNSFRTATGLASLTTNAVSRGNENENQYAVVNSKSVFGIIANGNMTTGIITAGGFEASDPSNHNYTVSPDATDVGANNFRQPFTGYPDALRLKVRYIPGKVVTSESEKEMFQAEISAWIHNSSKFQTPYESDVKGKAVALVSINPKYDNAREWTEFTQPFDYTIGNEGNIPAYVLISCGTNKTPGGGADNDVLHIDDMYFVYYSTLSDLKVNDTSIEGFDENVTEYTMDGPIPELSAIIATPKSRWATLDEIVQTVEDGKDVISITVKGNDFEASGNQTVYRLVYEQAVIDVEPIIGVYEGDLSIAGEEPTTDKISLTKDAEGRIGLHLKDFNFNGLPVGNIDIPNIPVALDGEIYRFESDNVTITFSIPLLGEISADVKATGAVTGNNIEIDIDVNVVDLGQIPVTFSGVKMTSGLKETVTDNLRMQISGSTVTIQDAKGLLQIYNISGALVHREVVDGSTTFSLEEGVYIVRMEGETTKILIK